MDPFAAVIIVSNVFANGESKNMAYHITVKYFNIYIIN